MRRLTFIISLISLAFLAACKEKECTPEIIETKGKELVNLSLELARKDPEKLAKIKPEFDKIMAKVNEDPNNLEIVCAATDKALALMK